MFRRVLALRCIPAPKKPKRAGFSAASAANPEAPAMPNAADVNVEVESSLDALKKLSPQQLEELERRLTDTTEREERLLNEDNLFQMDVSTKETPKPGGVKVFWKNVTVDKDKTNDAFYNVLLDSRRVKAFESTHSLMVPTLSYAHAVREEWASQVGVVNKSLMPLTDIASAAAYHVGASGVTPRVDYLSGFLRNDNSFFFIEQIAREQEKALEPVHKWFEQMFEVPCPRVEKLKYPNVPETDVAKIRSALSQLNMNTYQAVALCILCQYTASVVLPLAVLLSHGRVLSTPDMLRISRMEEEFNVKQHGAVAGYHDIREADVNAKVAAAVCAWRLTEGLSIDDCIPPVQKKQ